MLTKDSSWFYDSRLDVRVFLTSCGFEKQRYQKCQRCSDICCLKGEMRMWACFPDKPFGPEDVSVFAFCSPRSILVSREVYFSGRRNLGAVDQKPETRVRVASTLVGTMFVLWIGFWASSEKMDCEE